MDIEKDIVEIVKKLQRNVPPRYGVYPFMVQCWLDIYRAEGTLRRDMMTMAERGVLLRMGGTGARRGYRVPEPTFRTLSFLDATRLILGQSA